VPLLPNLFASVHAALLECGVDAKLARVAALQAQMQQGALDLSAPPQPPEAIDDAGRPPRPVLVAPRELRRRSTASTEGRAALMHAIAHIEFNAINLALDAVYRFPAMPAAFHADWLRIAAEEALHFALARDHLRTLGHDYGDFPAHAGLWAMAVKTAHDPLVRMALVPRVLEARGLDASPGIIRRLRETGDARAVEILETILRDEVSHVEAGSRWYEHLCRERGLDPESTFQQLLIEHDAPKPVRPLNVEARRRARFTEREIAALERSARGGDAP